MNHALTILPKSDPTQILRYRDRQFAAELIATALLHFDFFSWLSKSPGATANEICQHFGFALRPADVLLTLLRANGLIVTVAGGRNELTMIGKEYLVQGSPWYLGPYYAPLRDSAATKGFVQVLTTGKPANWQAKADGDDWHVSMRDPDFARGFTELMNCRGFAFGQHLAKALGPMLRHRTRLLDVGGGSGIYTTTMLAQHPQLNARILEQVPVDDLVREEVAKHGLANRIEVLTGDMFQCTWPETDILLLSNVLHDWDVPEVRALLERSVAALSPGGLLVIHEAFLNDDKSGPLPVAEYSALLMHITQGKCYTPGEFGGMMVEFGLTVGPYCDTLADRGFMTATKQ